MRKARVYLICGSGLIVRPLQSSRSFTTKSSHSLSTDLHWFIDSPTPEIYGYNFAYRGILSVWEGFPPSHQSHVTTTTTAATTATSVQPTPRLPHRSLLLEEGGPESQRHRSGSRHATGRRRHSKGPAEAVPEEYLSAIATLTARKDSGQSNWKPAVATAKLPQRQLALYMCGWALTDEDLVGAVKT